jgi:hypothetical protein
MDRTVRGRPGRPGRDLAVAAGEQVAVPAEHRIGADQQPDAAGQAVGESVQQGGQERPVGRGEPRPGRAELPLQDRDLVTQHQDLGVFVQVASWQQPQ